MTPSPESSSGIPPFIMHGSREVIDTGAQHINIQVGLIERAVQENNPGLVIDFSNSLIETACITILKDRGKPVPDNKNRPYLFRETINCLRLVSPDHPNSEEVERSIKKTIGSFLTLITAISELRRFEGTASHGKDAYKPQIDMVHAQLVARSADTIVNYLFNTHRMPFQYDSVRSHYADLPEFNEFIDENNEAVKIFDLTFDPSEVLYYTDNAAYFDKFNEFSVSESTEDESEPEKETETVSEKVIEKEKSA